MGGLCGQGTPQGTRPLGSQELGRASRHAARHCAAGRRVQWGGPWGPRGGLRLEEDVQGLKVGRLSRPAGGRPGQSVRSWAARAEARAEQRAEARGARLGRCGGEGGAAGARGPCVRALPLQEEDGPGGKVGVTRAAPGRSPGGTEASPTERRPPRLGGAQSGHRRHHTRPLTAGGRGSWESEWPGGAGGRARGSPAEGWAAPPASMSRRAV